MSKRFSSVWRHAIVLLGAVAVVVTPLLTIVPTASAARTCPDNAPAGFTYNAATDRCELVKTSGTCPDGTNSSASGRTLTCYVDAVGTAPAANNTGRRCADDVLAAGYTYNAATDRCEMVKMTGTCPANSNSTSSGRTLTCYVAAIGTAPPAQPAKTCPVDNMTYNAAKDRCELVLMTGTCPNGTTKDEDATAGRSLVCVAPAGSVVPPEGKTCPGTGYYNGTNCVVAAAANGSCPEGYTQDATAPQGSRLCKADLQNADANADDSDGCPVQSGTFFRWITCPVYEALRTFTNTLDKFIDAYMSTGNQIFTDTESGYNNAWKIFRNISLGLVVIAGLVMLVSEALNISIVDAYTVRKVLPRLLIAVIGISLSWELCKWVIGFFDDLGHAIGNTIYTAFGYNSPPDVISGVVGNLMANVGGTLTITAAAIFLGGWGILSLLGSLALAMFIAAAILVLRQAIIVAAVILAPLAIAAYILPNTNKLAHFWWDTLIRMLMLYPITVGLIALCKTMAGITLGLR